MTDSTLNQEHRLPSLKEVIKQHSLSAHKSLGQNFLLDMNLLCKIAKSAGAKPTETFLEIGPGPGGLTRALLAEGVDKVVVIEKDARCIDILREIQSVYGHRLDIIEGDALKIDLNSLFTKPFRIATNLPYNISSDFITSLLTDVSEKKWITATMMLQKEFALRLRGKVGTKDYSRLSVLSHVTCETEILFDVHPSNFTPAPKVLSAITRIKPKSLPVPCDLKELSDITRVTFGQRRKMIKSSLKQIHPNPSELCRQVGIPDTHRADHLFPEEYVALCLALKSYQNSFSS